MDNRTSESQRSAAPGERLGAPPVDADGRETTLSFCWWPLLWDQGDMRPTLRWLQSRIASDEADAAALEQLRQLALNLWEQRLEGALADEASVFFEVAQREAGSPLATMLASHELAHRQIALAALQLRVATITGLAGALVDFVHEVATHLDAEVNDFWPAIDRVLDRAEVERLAEQLDHRRTRDGRGTPGEGRALRDAAAARVGASRPS